MNTPPYTNPRDGIHYDDAYRKTTQRDNCRQVVRRLTHSLASIYEKTLWLPRWQKPQKPVENPPTLSTCIITMNSAQRIRPLLEHIRPWSDEIVVGVDSKTTDATWQACQGLADTVFTIENDALTCNGGLRELVSRCTGDWVLRLDDDEFPEPHLTSLLPGLMTQTRFTHYKLPRLHLTAYEPDTNQLWWSPGGYLYPDFQMRLFKNDSTLLTFPEAVGHATIGCAGKRGKINTVNLIHLNMAINPRWRREAKLANYIKRLGGGWVHPVNERALLFEDFGYPTKPYSYPDTTFCHRLAETISHQRQAYDQ